MRGASKPVIRAGQQDQVCIFMSVVGGRPQPPHDQLLILLFPHRSCLLLHQFEHTLPKDSLLRKNLEEVCIDTVFGARGVQLLNERGLAVMKETEVPVVPAHMLVEGQQWATPVSARLDLVVDDFGAICEN